MQAWLPTLLGLIAGCCSTAAFVPQVLKIWREGDTRAISARMYVLRVIGFVLWLGYGFALGSMPLIVFNIASLLLGGTVLVLKLRGRAPPDQPGKPPPGRGDAAAGKRTGRSRPCSATAGGDRRGWEPG
jgi:MtN3 and saliva related transmembrane protein